MCGDVRVIQRRQRLRLAREPRQPIGIAGEGVRQDFERDVAIELRIARAVHLAHPAGAQQRENFERPKERAGRKAHAATRF